MIESVGLGGTFYAHSQSHESFVKDKYSHDHVCCVLLL